MNKKYAIVYKNRPSFKGIDAYRQNGSPRVGRFSDHCLFDRRSDAEEVALEFPVYTKGHLPAQVVECNMRVEKSKWVPSYR